MGPIRSIRKETAVPFPGPPSPSLQPLISPSTIRLFYPDPLSLIIYQAAEQVIEPWTALIAREPYCAALITCGPHCARPLLRAARIARRPYCARPGLRAARIARRPYCAPPVLRAAGVPGPRRHCYFTDPRSYRSAVCLYHKEKLILESHTGMWPLRGVVRAAALARAR